jgi:hypothetical protein
MKRVVLAMATVCVIAGLTMAQQAQGIRNFLKINT